MNIDWSKAPQDATHAGNSPYEQGVVTWFKGISDPSSRNYFMNAGSMNAWAVSNENLSAWDLIERPNKQESWDGAGLPPVGTVCECHLPGELIQNYSWVEAKIIWHNGPTECAVVRSTSRLAWCDEFRPIRTAEQVAAEEREKAIKEICIDAGSPEMTPGQMKVAEKLYMAGYRKQ